MIRVYAPASIGNIGVGFDILGMAIVPIDGTVLGDYVSIEDAKNFTIKNTGMFYDQIPIQLEENIVFQCWKRFCEVVGKTYTVTIQLEKNIPVSSGLGSSACSIVATLLAMNIYCGNPIHNDQLLKLMGEMEGKISGSNHFDNVSPCFLGGTQLILPKYDKISQLIPSFDNWLWIIAYPGLKISTMMSRSVLPNQHNHIDCVKHSQFLSGFVHACHTKQEFLAIKCMQDVIVEPYRAKLLPLDLEHVRLSLIEKGAVSCGISGSGPSIFALCNNKQVVNDVVEWLSRFYLKNSMGFVKVCSLSHSGAHVVVE